MQQIRILRDYNRLIPPSRPVLIWASWAYKRAEQLKNDPFSHGIVLEDWRDIVKELSLAGYNMTRIAAMTGISRRNIQRWFNDPEEIASPRMFSAILCLYCYFRMEISYNKRSLYAEQSTRP